jgi:hypothetical protein
MASKAEQDKKSRKRLVFLAFSALGVVYGDIGTSPLYAMKICFHGRHSVAVTQENVFGVLSLIFWALMMVISIKYLLFILRADNQGEGGILALMELVLPRKRGRRRALVILVGLFGAALLYGDGTITPAISVLSAIEGLEIATPVFKPYVVPITLVILFFLFFLQHRGTGKVGLLFGPVMLTWFLVIGAVGFLHVVQNPAVFNAINPSYGLHFLQEQSFRSLYILGAVFLVVTGGEALYAFRQVPCPAVMVYGRAFLPAVELFWSGRLAAEKQLHGEQSLLQFDPALGALPDGFAGHMRYDHRFPGYYFRGFFAYFPGPATWLSAPASGRSYFGGGKRTNLYAARQLAAIHRNSRSGCWFQIVRESGRRLWSCRIGDHGNHHRPELCGYDRFMELAETRCDTHRIHVPPHRCLFF